MFISFYIVCIFYLQLLVLFFMLQILYVRCRYDVNVINISLVLKQLKYITLANSSCWLVLQVFSQDETPLPYSLVFGEGVVNDTKSVVLFNAIQSFDLTHIDSKIALKFIGSFLYLFAAITLLGVLVSHSLSHAIHSIRIPNRILIYLIWCNFSLFLAKWAT